MTNRKARVIVCAAALLVLVFAMGHAPFLRATSFLYPVTQPVKVFTGADGKPLDRGYIYFGTANQNPETNPVQMYWDVGGTIPAAQPFRTVFGYISRNGVSPANVFATGDFSITVKDSKGVVVVTSPVSADLQLALAITGIGTAAAIPIADAGAYYPTDNVEAALQSIASPGFLTQTNLAASLQALLVPTGVEMQYVGTTAPTGYVLEDGKTIGDVSSAATERANADTSALYTLLWNSVDNTRLPIQDSTGTPTTRGSSASNDFAAHKRLSLPDARGRLHAGVDNMGGSTASRITATTNFDATINGNTGGSQNHTLTTAELAAHSHGYTDPTHNHTAVVTDPGHFHTSVLDTAFAAGGGATNVRSTLGGTTVNTDVKATGITVANVAAATGITISNSGSGTAHTVLQPTIVSYVIIKL